MTWQAISATRPCSGVSFGLPAGADAFFADGTVGRRRLTVLKTMLKAPMLSALETRVF